MHPSANWTGERLSVDGGGRLCGLSALDTIPNC